MRYSSKHWIPYDKMGKFKRHSVFCRRRRSRRPRRRLNNSLLMVVGGSWQWVVVGVVGVCVGRRGCVGRLCWEGIILGVVFGEASKRCESYEKVLGLHVPSKSRSVFIEKCFVYFTKWGESCEKVLVFQVPSKCQSVFIEKLLFYKMK